MEDYFDSINVEHLSAHNDEMKVNYAEHVMHTLKSSLWNYMSSISTSQRKAMKSPSNCVRYPLLLKRGIMFIYLTRHRHTNEVMTKSGPEKYLKFINLLCTWECTNIVSVIYKGRT